MNRPVAPDPPAVVAGCGATPITEQILIWVSSPGSLHTMPLLGFMDVQSVQSRQIWYFIAFDGSEHIFP